MHISIDPGINNTGICLFDIIDDKFTVLDTSLVFNIRKFTTDEKTLSAVYGDRFPKLLSILSRITSMLEKAAIDKEVIETIIAEAPFYSSFRPQTFGSIVEVLTLIKYEIAYKYSLGFKLIEPLLIKKTFSTFSLATKDKMKETLQEKVLIKDIILNVDIESLSEHEIDAIAIGYVFYILGRRS